MPSAVLPDQRCDGERVLFASSWESPLAGMSIHAMIAARVGKERVSRERVDELIPQGIGIAREDRLDVGG